MPHPIQEIEYTVTSLSLALKQIVEQNFEFVRIRGEISGAKRASSGHWYFSLKDESSLLEAVCWKGTASRFSVQPEEGMEVICTGKVTIYPGRSRYQIVVESMEPAGIGALMALLEKRKQRFIEEGIFDPIHKKPLPFAPKIIGVITSPTGAVIQDILHRIGERFPTRVLIWPVAVQGEKAALQIAEAIGGFNNPNFQKIFGCPDVLIVARGGGSIEDLWAFNEEIVVRAIAASTIPLISAIGHETDTSLADYAADLRAPTPTAAAEIAVPVREHMLYDIEEKALRMKRWMARLVQEKNQAYREYSSAFPASSSFLEHYVQRVDESEEKLRRYIEKILTQCKMELIQRATKIIHPAVRICYEQERYLRLSQDLQRFMQQGYSTSKHLFNLIAQKYQCFSFVERKIEPLFLNVEKSETRLKNLYDFILREKAHSVRQMEGLLESYHYHNVLKRGFAVIRKEDNSFVTSSSQGRALDRFYVEWHDGLIEAKKAVSFDKNTSQKKVVTLAPKQNMLF